MSQRPLLAARTSSGEKDGATGGASPGANRPPGSSGPGRTKRTLIESACSACRRRKSRCDGQRPTCSRCQSLRTDCHYEAEEGESRWSALRRRNQVLEAERDQLRELMHFVQTRPEPEAQELFQRIRQTGYDDLFILLRHIKESAMSVQQQQQHQQSMGAPGLPLTTTTSGEQRLPPIQDILDPARGVMPPAQLVHSHSLSSEDSSRGSNDTPMAVSSLPSGHPAHRHPLDTLEPSLREQSRRPPHLLSNQSLSLSSEESTGSMSSTSAELQNPYYLPNNKPPNKLQGQQLSGGSLMNTHIYAADVDYFGRRPN